MAALAHHRQRGDVTVERLGGRQQSAVEKVPRGACARVNE
jgi:hypothetical protein